MKLASLGSGSGGNATLIDTGEGLIMIDCGFSLREVERRLERLDCSIKDVAAVLVTHEHSDHMAGVGRLARRYQLPVFLTHGTARSLAAEAGKERHLVNADRPFELLGLEILPVAVPHDAREPVQFVLRRGEIKLGVLTDLGSLTPRILQAYRDCDLLLVEANHDQVMLRDGPYPERLKQRVGGPWGHLNNDQTAEFLRQVNPGKRLKSLILGHISQHNNARARVAAAVAELVVDIPEVLYASQEDALSWIGFSTTQEITPA